MYGTAHAAVAASAVTLLKLSQPFAVLAVSWVSHYACDAVPHGDTVPAAATALERQRWYHQSINAALIDTGLLFWLWHRRNQRRGHSWPFTLAVLGSLGPDALQMVERLIGIRFFWGWPEAVHRFCHNPFDVILPLWLGWLLQLALAASLWRWLLKSPPEERP